MGEPLIWGGGYPALIIKISGPPDYPVLKTPDYPALVRVIFGFRVYFYVYKFGPVQIRVRVGVGPVPAAPSVGVTLKGLWQPPWYP